MHNNDEFEMLMNIVLLKVLFILLSIDAEVSKDIHLSRRKNDRIFLMPMIDFTIKIYCKLKINSEMKF